MFASKRYLLICCVLATAGLCTAVHGQKAKPVFGPWDGTGIVTGKLGDNQFGDRAWTVNLSMPSRFTEVHPTVVGDHIVVAARKDDQGFGGERVAIKAFRIADGREAWAHSNATALIGAHDGRVFFLDGEKLSAMDAKSGKVAWTWPAMGSCFLTTAGVLVVSPVGIVQIHGYKKGEPVWKNEFKLADNPERIWLDTASVYLATSSKVVSCELKSGKKSWELSIDRDHQEYPVHAFDGNVLICAGNDLRKVDGKSGTELARIRARVIEPRCWTVGDSLYVLDGGMLRESGKSDLKTRRVFVAPRGWINTVTFTDDAVLVSQLSETDSAETFVLDRQDGRFIQAVPGGGAAILAPGALVVYSWRKQEGGLPQAELQVFPLEAGNSRHEKSTASPTRTSFDGPLARSGNLHHTASQQHGTLAGKNFEQEWQVQFDCNIGEPEKLLPMYTAVTCGVIAALGTSAVTRIVAHDVETGKELWRCETRGIANGEMLIADGSRFYVLGRYPGPNTVTSLVWALDPATGRVLYFIDLGMSDSRLFLDGDELHVWGNSDPPGASIDPATGTVLQTYKPDKSAPHLLEIQDGVAYLTDPRRRRLVAWSLKDRKELWSYAVPGTFPQYNDEKHVYSNREQLYVFLPDITVALDVKTGQQRWTLEHGSVHRNMRVVTSKHVVWCVGDKLVATSVSDGKPDKAMTEQLRATVVGRSVEGMVTMDDSIIVSTNEMMAVLGQDGSLRQRLDQTGHALAGCGSVFAVGGDGTVRRLVPK